MFTRKQAQERPESEPALQQTVGTPQSLTATGIYVDLVESLKVRSVDATRDKRLWQAVALVMLIAVVVMLPLRKREPYFYEVNTATGEIVLSARVVEQLKTSDKNISYFLRIWASRLVSINALTLRDNLPAAYRWTRGSATTQLDAWAEEEDKTAERIAKTPGLTREIIGVPTVSFNAERTTALIDFVWLEKVNGKERERKRKLLTVEFSTEVAADEQRRASDDADNPLGIAITHFTINDQVVQ